MKVIIISPEENTLTFFEKVLKDLDIDLTYETSLASSVELMHKEHFDVVILDSSFRKYELIHTIGKIDRKKVTFILVLLGPHDETQRELILKKLNADYSINHGEDDEYTADSIRKIIERKLLRETVGFIGISLPVQELMETITQIAPTPLNVLVTGESGTGKELVARAVHLLSTRKTKPFLAVNCSALAEGVLESELFGHEKGAFTGAIARREGMFKKADGGTLFLDEIGDITHHIQIKLLRVLEEGEFMRVGGTEPITVNVRIITATNRDLRVEVGRGNFRRDLYYRIKVLEIKVPTLRERREDIPLLVEYFAIEYAKRNGTQPVRFTSKTMDEMSGYPWYGNIRELKNYVESLIALSRSRIVHPEDLPPIQETEAASKNLPIVTERTTDSVGRELIYRTMLTLREEIAEIRRMMIDLGVSSRTHIPVESSFSGGIRVPEAEEIQDDESETMEDIECQAIRNALRKVGGNRKKAAQRLSISERTLYRKIKEYNL